MGGLIFIIPILAFDIWLSCTTGKRQVRRWLELKQWRQLAAACAIGAALGIWLTFFIKYGSGPKIRVQGFPVPLVFFHLEDTGWTRSVLSTSLLYAGATADFFIPYKIAEFLKVVKEELK
jgi:hypothetical protein